MKLCDDYQALISAYIDDEASAEETAAMFRHLGACAECRTFLRSAIRLDSLMLPHEPERKPAPPPPMRIPFLKRKFSLSLPAAAAAAAWLVVSASIIIFSIIYPPSPAGKPQTEYVFVASLPIVDVVATPPHETRSNGGEP
ncbi:MAG: zf-HC2 domain-containing protein [Acidobacteriota bacterium]